MKKKIMAVIACITLGLILDASVFAEQGHESNKNLKTSIPATSSEILTAVDARIKNLENIITSNTLDKVHVMAFEIRDLLLALPEKSNALTEEEKNVLESSLKKIKQQASLLDKYGDAKDMAQTKAVFGKFKEEIEKIKKMPGLKP